MSTLLTIWCLVFILPSVCLGVCPLAKSLMFPVNLKTCLLLIMAGRLESFLSSHSFQSYRPLFIYFWAGRQGKVALVVIGRCCYWEVTFNIKKTLHRKSCCLLFGGGVFGRCPKGREHCSTHYPCTAILFVYERKKVVETHHLLMCYMSSM